MKLMQKAESKQLIPKGIASAIVGYLLLNLIRRNVRYGFYNAVGRLAIAYGLWKIFKLSPRKTAMAMLTA